MSKRTSIIVKIILVLAIPTAVSFIYCIIRGVSFGDLYLPASYNNDCVYYYKLVEAVTKNISHMGYFGFNESHAAIGGFAAWSPLIVLPWSLWAVVFGWNYSSVIVCNIVLFSLALAAFTYLSDIDFKGLGILFLMLLLFPSFSIHLLNALPEIVMASVVLLYLGFAVRLANRETKTSYIIVMFALAGYLTIVRPYMVLLMILPAYYLGKKKIQAGWIAFVTVSLVSLVANVLIGRYFSSEYFDPLFKLDIVKLFLEGKFTEGFWSAVYMFRSMTAELGQALADAFTMGITMGIQYAVAIVTAILAFVFSLKKGEDRLRPLCLLFSGSVFALLLAIVFFLQKVNEGGRHIWVFAFIGIILCCVEGWGLRGAVMKSAVVLMLIVFCCRGAIVPTDYDVPIGDESIKDNVEYWKQIFNDGATFDEDAKGYDNTIIWVFVDYADGNEVVTTYNELYALPSGTGISCCYPDYVMNNFEGLQSRYILTDSRGGVAKLCEDAGLKVVGRRENVIMYQR